MSHFVVVRREYVNDTLVDEAVMAGSSKELRSQAEQVAREASRGYQFFEEVPERGFCGHNTGSNVFCFTSEPAASAPGKTF